MSSSSSLGHDGWPSVASCPQPAPTSRPWRQPAARSRARGRGIEGGQRQQGNRHASEGKHEARSRYGLSIYSLQWDSMHHREKVEVRKYVKHFQWEKVYWEISKQEMNCTLLSIIQRSSDIFNIHNVDTKCCIKRCMSGLVFSVNLLLVWGGRHPLAVLQGILLSKKLIGLMSFTVIVPYLSRERGALWSILKLYIILNWNIYIVWVCIHLQCIEICYKVCLPYLHPHPLSLEAALCVFSFAE